MGICVCVWGYFRAQFAFGIRYERDLRGIGKIAISLIERCTVCIYVCMLGSVYRMLFISYKDN